MRRTEMNTDIIGEGQTGGRGEPLHAAEMTRRGSNRQFGRQFDRATTSLTPYGMSFWALILAACGGGGGGPTTSAPAPAAQPQMLQRSGNVYDGPVRDAGVYVDVDGDGRLNKQIDYFIGRTNASGNFSGAMPAQHQGKRYIVDLTGATDLGDDGREGGTGVNADRELSGTWLAPEGASVVSALTHLIATGITTRQQVESAFPNFDPLVDNPYGLELTPQKSEAYAAVREALPGITRFIEENRDLINENAKKIRGLETTVANLEGKVGALQQLVLTAFSGNRPDITKSGSLTLDLAETTSSSAADTGLRFVVSDADGNFTGPPTVDDFRFELGRAGQEWGLWVRANQTFRAGESITLTITATDSTRREGTYEIELGVVSDTQPPVSPPDPPSEPLEIPDLVPLGLTPPVGEQPEIEETIGESVIGGSQPTGFILTSTVAGLVAAARRDDDKAFVIYSRRADGDITPDDRFVVREDGNLSVKKDVRLDFESADNPNGRIELQIFFVHNNVMKARQDVSLQLTSVNESPIGEIQLVGIGGTENVPITGRQVSIGTHLGVDLSNIRDPDGDSLSYKFSWFNHTVGFVSRQATYTPEKAGRYDVSVHINDGSVTIHKRLSFLIVEESSGQAGGRAVNTEVLDEGFVPEAGMEELDAPLNEFL